ncbi:homeobox protein NOBOX [Ambystoma mexicanum]|uniref:homeobox protein NOBOX n=1 Tax=Ambystoma mexicanum TaxID=8296 RepID=UPI0037E74FD2
MEAEEPVTVKRSRGNDASEKEEGEGEVIGPFQKPSLFCDEHLDGDVVGDESDGASEMGSDMELSHTDTGASATPAYRTVIIEDDTAQGEYCLVQVTEADPTESLPEEPPSTATHCSWATEATGHPGQTVAYYLSDAGELEESDLHPSAPGDILGLSQFQAVNLKIDPGNIPRRSARCAAASTTARGPLRLSSFVYDAAKAEKKRDFPEEMGLPPAKKKTRTLYSAEQLEELERAFQEEHYPDGEKRKEIASEIGVTPQRIMVWFQNRRAKWRKVEKLCPKGIKKCPVASATLSVASTAGSLGHLPVSFSNSSCAVKEAQLLPAHPGAFHGHHSAFLKMTAQPGGYGTLPGDSCIPTSATPHLASGTSFSGPLTPVEVEQTPTMDCVSNMPTFHSPPPLRRASLPLSMAFNPTNHIIPLMLDTPESTCTPSPQDGDSTDVFSYNVQASGLSSPCTYQDQLGTSGVKMGHRFYHHAAASSNQPAAFQVGQFPTHQFHHLPLHIAHGMPPSLTPTTPNDGTGATFLALSGNLAYGAASSRGYLHGHSGGQIMLQQSGGTGGIAFQTMPWSDVYMQRVPFPGQLLQHAPQFAGASSRYSTDHGLYTQAASTVAHPVARFGQTVKGSTAIAPVTGAAVQPQCTYQAQHGQAAEYNMVHTENSAATETQESQSSIAYQTEAKN